MKAGIYGGLLFIPYVHAKGGRWSTGEPNYDEQVFSLIRRDSDRVYHFDIQRLLKLIREHAPPFDLYHEVTIDFDQADVDHIMRHHGIEEAGIARLTPARLEEPGIMCSLDDGSDCIVDGNHRLVRRFREGLRQMKLYRLTEEQWRLALLDIPDSIGRPMAEIGTPEHFR